MLPIQGIFWLELVDRALIKVLHFDYSKFLRGSKQEQKYFRIAILVITYFCISAADTGLELVERDLIKVLHSIIQSFCYPIEKLGSVF